MFHEPCGQACGPACQAECAWLAPAPTPPHVPRPAREPSGCTATLLPGVSASCCENLPAFLSFCPAPATGPQVMGTLPILYPAWPRLLPMGHSISLVPQPPLWLPPCCSGLMADCWLLSALEWACGLCGTQRPGQQRGCLSKQHGPLPSPPGVLSGPL